VPSFVSGRPVVRTERYSCFFKLTTCVVTDNVFDAPGRLAASLASLDGRANLAADEQK
jgi:hypothetical protein